MNEHRVSKKWIAFTLLLAAVSSVLLIIAVAGSGQSTAYKYGVGELFMAAAVAMAMHMREGYNSFFYGLASIAFFICATLSFGFAAGIQL